LPPPPVAPSNTGTVAVVVPSILPSNDQSVLIGPTEIVPPPCA